MTLEATYRKRFDEVLGRLAQEIEKQLRDYMTGEPHIDRITARAKSVDRFIAKAGTTNNGRPKYTEPLEQIQDQVGARIVAFYITDVDRIAGIITKYYRAIESKHLIPDSEWEFGYVGRHFILFIPPELFDEDIDQGGAPRFFELQIKTLFQHAWSEANHDLGYKPGGSPLTSDETRRLAFTAAQAWGADQIFNELYEQRRRPLERPAE